ncbi:survival motor neuron protein [Eurosta solidaginis]|uniref:survival motor neuron protein n=1 Tax=Eurosta solidaginis TaxID=178769 RepID=UPI0035315140
MESMDCRAWDETLFVKSYYKSLELVGEHIARQIAESTNESVTRDIPIGNTSAAIFKVGDYVRATFERDGCDYEAKIISIDIHAGSCVVKYIGYDNEDNVLLKHLVSSWGKKYRRLQYETAMKFIKRPSCHGGIKNKSHDTSKGAKSVPPPPPVPSMLYENLIDSEHLSAMLMAWYMSGYYTGIYEATKITNNSNES